MVLGVIRTATSDHIDAIRAIEAAAGAPFRAIGMPEIADAELPTAETLRSFVDDGRAWVYCAGPGGGGAPVGFLLVDAVDGAAHIAQVSVRPSHRGRRIGAALIRHAERWALERGLTTLTLTTFRDVPWNAPYYQRLGFTALAHDDLTTELREIVEVEGRVLAGSGARVVLSRPCRPDP
jgi:GNAT superfamily N-acetyltransferase